MSVVKSLIGLISWIFTEVNTLFHILLSPVKGSTHKERLESFYKLQAQNYDSYRKRLLHGREGLFEKISQLLSQSSKKERLVWVDMGAGTGYNCEIMNTEIMMKDSSLPSLFSKVYLVDLSTSLLKQAQERINQKSWNEIVTTCEADATKFTIPEKQPAADLVTFSYSLTMIPDWFSAMEQAISLLKPGGYLAIVDFYVGRKYPKEGEIQQSWFTRTFWRTFFALDNVRLSDDHIPFLESRHNLRVVFKSEKNGGIPYIPLIKAPHYLLILQKTQ